MGEITEKILKCASSDKSFLGRGGNRATSDGQAILFQEELALVFVQID